MFYSSISLTMRHIHVSGNILRVHLCAFMAFSRVAKMLEKTKGNVKEKALSFLLRSELIQPSTG